MLSSSIIVLASIALCGLLCQWIAWATKLPAILFLLLAGIVLGPLTGWLRPDDLMGDLLLPLVSMAVAIILFEGSLTLKRREMKGIARLVRRVVSLGALITWLGMSALCHYLLAFDWSLSLVFGALVVVTGPTVIVPMLRSVRPNSRIANLLRWEGIVIDPIGALLAVLVFETILPLNEGEGFLPLLWIFVKSLLAGGIVGIGLGQTLGWLLRHQWLPSYLQNMGTIALVLTAFAISNFLAEESGLLAVTLMGFWLTNMKDVNIEDILSFKENLSVLLISGLFILLAARIEPAQLAVLGYPALVLIAALQFVVRPVAIYVSALGSDLDWREKLLVSWIGPRGIVAAAISAFFALRLEQAGFEQAYLLVPLTFSIIIGTVLFQSATARPLARLLKVAEPSSTGVLIVGANLVARTIATELKELGIPTLLTDSSWDNISTARMAGLNTFYGNPVSEFADKHLDLVGLGKLMALSPHREHNALAGMRYRLEFGSKNIYSIPVAADQHLNERTLIAAKHKGQTLFQPELTYGRFSNLLRQGAKLRRTTLSDSFSFEDMMRQAEGKLYPLFALNKQGKISYFTTEYPVKPDAGWQVTSLDYSAIESRD